MAKERKIVKSKEAKLVTAKTGNSVLLKELTAKVFIERLKKLISLLDKYAATMPRTLLRYSIEHFNKKEREYYMGLKKES